MIYCSLIKANKSCYFVWIDFEWQISRTRPVADYGIEKKKKKKKKKKKDSHKNKKDKLNDEYHMNL